MIWNFWQLSVYSITIRTFSTTIEADYCLRLLIVGELFCFICSRPELELPGSHASLLVILNLIRQHLLLSMPIFLHFPFLFSRWQVQAFCRVGTNRHRNQWCRESWGKKLLFGILPCFWLSDILIVVWKYFLAYLDKLILF